MTEPEPDYGERLRRALHAAADSVVPSEDGLERIRSRIAHEPARTASASACSSAGCDRSPPTCRAGLPDPRPVIAALKPALLAAASDQIRARSHRLDGGGAEVRRAAATASQRGGRLRPVLATAGAVLVAAAAILATPGLRQLATVQISSLIHSPRVGQLTRDHPGRLKPPRASQRSPQGLAPRDRAPLTPITSPPQRRSSARPSHLPTQPTTPLTTCAPVPGQASPAATPAAAPRPASTTALRRTRTTCRTPTPTPTPTPTLTWAPTPTPPQASPPTPTPTLSPTPSGLPTRQGSAPLADPDIGHIGDIGHVAAAAMAMRAGVMADRRCCSAARPGRRRGVPPPGMRRASRSR